jgi:hypothetical protein
MSLSRPRANALAVTAALAVAACLLAGCGVTIVNGSGKSITQSRPVAGFQSVSLEGMGDIAIVQSGTESLTIEAEDNVMPLIKTEVKNGVLTIRFEQKNWQDVIKPAKPIRFALGVKALSGVELSGAGNIVAPSLKVPTFTIKISGAGAVKIDKLEAAEVSTSVSGLGNVELAGVVAKQTLDFSGAGQYLAGALAGRTAKITLSGGGNATIWAVDALDVTINGAGQVSYFGSPKLTKSITGVGMLSPLGPK